MAWRWPNEIPVGGEPADVEAAVTDHNLKLQQSEIPKLLLYATPGAVLTAPLVEWCRRSLKNLTAVNVGAGAHYLQEDHPHEIGQAIASWYRDLQDEGDLQAVNFHLRSIYEKLHAHSRTDAIARALRESLK